MYASYLIPDSQIESWTFFFLPTWPKNPIWLLCMTEIHSKHFYLNKSFTCIMTEQLIYMEFWFHFSFNENITIAKLCFFNISRKTIKICNGNTACDACLKETGKYWDTCHSTLTNNPDLIQHAVESRGHNEDSNSTTSLDLYLEQRKPWEWQRWTTRSLFWCFQ